MWGNNQKSLIAASGIAASMLAGVGCESTGSNRGETPPSEPYAWNGPEPEADIKKHVQRTVAPEVIETFSRAIKQQAGVSTGDELGDAAIDVLTRGETTTVTWGVAMNNSQGRQGNQVDFLWTELDQPIGVRGVLVVEDSGEYTFEHSQFITDNPFVNDVLMILQNDDGMIVVKGNVNQRQPSAGGTMNRLKGLFGG